MEGLEKITFVWRHHAKRLLQSCRFCVMSADNSLPILISVHVGGVGHTGQLSPHCHLHLMVEVLSAPSYSLRTCVTCVVGAHGQLSLMDVRHPQQDAIPGSIPVYILSGMHLMLCAVPIAPTLPSATQPLAPSDQQSKRTTNIPVPDRTMHPEIRFLTVMLDYYAVLAALFPTGRHVLFV